MLQKLETCFSKKLLDCAMKLNVTVPYPSVDSKGIASSVPPQSKVPVSCLSLQDNCYSVYCAEVEMTKQMK